MPQYFFKKKKTKKRKKIFFGIIILLIIILLLIIFLKSDSKQASINNQENEIEVKKNKPETSQIKKNEYIIQPGEAFSLLYKKLELSKEQVQQIYQSAKNIYNLENIKAGNKIEIIFKNNKFQEFIYNIDKDKFLSLKNNNSGLIAKLKKYNYKTKIFKKEGIVKSSFYASAKNNNIPDKIIMEMANIFAWDIDFGFDIKKGDTFKVLYEKRFLNGKEVDTGKILAAKFVNMGEDHYGLYYNHQNGDFDYYDLEGKNLRRTFLKSPLQYKYISSSFTYKRWHPKFGGYTPHLAIDYAAPSGTPVVSSGKGRVISIGWRNCIGKTIEIRHNEKYTTRYSHLLSYARGISHGTNISQGQIIGYVGSTGSCSTGPHLEYAMKIYNQAINPLLQKFSSVGEISEQEKYDFNIKKRGLLEMLGEK
ncbi:MAG TPA: peptidoglycan DD-metalloendopeptidase family protein [Patescibacteria group bacterium]|nr:peptidoglycan DD-metalloendopeptidase family protein [Patescibacteria group bacterium]